MHNCTSFDEEATWLVSKTPKRRDMIWSLLNICNLRIEMVEILIKLPS
jgi:hypothetical protein